MPTYEYACGNCGITVEITASVSENIAPRCDCGQMMTRKYSAPGIVFKGTGFYKTGG